MDEGMKQTNDWLLSSTTMEWEMKQTNDWQLSSTMMTE
jgi:hypothetical protein